MTHQEINQAIAETCGWTDVQVGARSKELIGKSPTDGDYWPIASYCTDLNAMWEAEKSLNKMDQHTYAIHLGEVTKSEYHDDMSFFCATARQRAEAFLRTLNKWEEVAK